MANTNWKKQNEPRTFEYLFCNLSIILYPILQKLEKVHPFCGFPVSLRGRRDSISMEQPPALSWELAVRDSCSWALAVWLHTKITSLNWNWDHRSGLENSFFKVHVNMNFWRACSIVILASLIPVGRLHMEFLVSLCPHWISIPSSQSDACSTQPLSEGGVLGEERGQEESSKQFS